MNLWLFSLESHPQPDNYQPPQKSQLLNGVQRLSLMGTFTPSGPLNWRLHISAVAEAAGFHTCLLLWDRWDIVGYKKKGQLNLKYLSCFGLSHTLPLDDEEHFFNLMPVWIFHWVAIAEDWRPVQQVAPSEVDWMSKKQKTREEREKMIAKMWFM